MKTVLVRAPLLTTSGYGVHSRQLFRWLLNKDDIDLRTNTVPWGITSWIINPDYENGLVGEAMQRSSPTQNRPDVTFQLQLPNEWDPNLGKYNVGVSAVVETDKCNPEWINCCNRMDAVVVPSEHTANVLRETGKINVPLYVIGESFTDECKDSEALDLDIDTNFNFLVLGQLTDHDPYRDRKNVLFTLRWLCEEFADDPDVGIIIKTNTGKGTKIDRKATQGVLKGVLKEIRKGPYPKVHFVHGNMKPSEVAGLYKNESVKALVTATRGEGFGLPLVEAAACGLPVVATNWSGHLDFLDLGKWLKVDYDLVEIPKSRVDNHIFINQTKWAEPKEDDFKQTVRKFRKKPQKPQEWAKELKDKIHEKFSFDAIEKSYEKHFGKLL